MEDEEENTQGRSNQGGSSADSGLENSSPGAGAFDFRSIGFGGDYTYKQHPLARLKLVLAGQNFTNQTVRALGGHAPYITPLGIVHRSSALGPIEEYPVELANAVRSGDMAKLWCLVPDARAANMQNKWGNSLLMLACRYMGNTGDAVKLLLHRQASVCVCCDAGKTPMHDLCWMIRTEEQFELFKLVMFAAGPPRNLLLVEDHHGQTPLDYLPEDLYEKCNAFIEQHKNVFWPRVELKLRRLLLQRRQERQPPATANAAATQ